MLYCIEEHFNIEDHVRVEKPLLHFRGGEELTVVEADNIICFKVLVAREFVGQVYDFPVEVAEQYLKTGVLEILA